MATRKQPPSGGVELRRRHLELPAGIAKGQSTRRAAAAYADRQPERYKPAMQCYSLKMKYLGAFVFGLLLLGGRYSVGAPRNCFRK